MPAGVALTVPASLSTLLPGDARTPEGGRATVVLAASSWRSFTDELHARFPVLAAHVLSAEGDVASGFVLVIDDELVLEPPPVALRPGQRVYLIPAMAGG
jgi:hypothetical protein